MEFEIEFPRSPEEAVRVLSSAAPGSVSVLAGGTDLLLDIESGRARPKRLLSLRYLPWRGVERSGGRLRIGSLLPLRDLEERPGLGEALPGLLEAIRAVGSPALRARATLGGNVVRGSPASDLLPVLLALEAEVLVRGPEGPRRVPLPELLQSSRQPALLPAELVEAIEIPDRAPSAFLWQRVRPTNDISQVGVAVALPRPDGPWRVALGGVAPVPRRLPEAEAELPDARPSEASIRAAAEAAARWASFVTDRRASEAHRRRIVAVLIARALGRAIARGPGATAGR